MICSEQIPLILAFVINLTSSVNAYLHYEENWFDFKCMGEHYWVAEDGDNTFLGDEKMKWYRVENRTLECPIDKNMEFKIEKFDGFVRAYIREAQIDEEENRKYMMKMVFVMAGIAVTMAVQHMIFFLILCVQEEAREASRLVDDNRRERRSDVEPGRTRVEMGKINGGETSDANTPLPL